MFNFTASNRNFFMTEGTALLNQYDHETAEKGNVTVIICDKGSTGYYFGLEGIQS